MLVWAVSGLEKRGYCSTGTAFGCMLLQMYMLNLNLRNFWSCMVVCRLKKFLIGN